MPLTRKDIRYLRSRAHALKPVVITGNAGLSPAVLNEIDAALAHHELIKVRVNAADREERAEMVETICQACTAEHVQTIGHIVVLYRRAQKPLIEFPSA